ncbi:endonuclease-reverse transcriptase [Elysia marginata]|uniref:Endonuclease-reverse transcriptase n=1 Tax=Elysia marginata TaxID=1093978 RepID=A0AAV4JCF3_9GAST|nr:endonuclease-reverse transcriptase [Elysia marginata]
MDWLMHNVTRDKHQGIQCTTTALQEDLDYADDLGLSFHRHQDIQLKTKDLCQTASKIGLRVNIRKTQAQRTNTNPITVEKKPLEEVQ